EHRCTHQFSQIARLGTHHSILRQQRWGRDLSPLLAALQLARTVEIELQYLLTLCLNGVLAAEPRVHLVTLCPASTQCDRILGLTVRTYEAAIDSCYLL